LKQNSTSAARWLYDLLHDYRHTVQHPDISNSEIVELPPTSAERRDSVDEVDASDFAGEVILAGHDEELVEACRDATQGHLQRLKKELPGVAKRLVSTWPRLPTLWPLDCRRKALIGGEPRQTCSLLASARGSLREIFSLSMFDSAFSP